jgi:predicted nucleotidyltransferase
MQTDNSDIDLLLDLGVDEKNPTIDYVYDLLDILESNLKLRVDYLTVNGIKANPSASFKKNVEDESWWFYEA